MVDLKPIAAEPVFASLLRSRRRRQVYLTVVIGGSILAFIVSFLCSPYTIQQMVNVIADDVRRALHMGPADRFSQLSNLPIWPFWRDIYSQFAAFVMLATPVLVAVQWNGYRRVFSEMSNSGSLSPVIPGGSIAINAEIGKANRFFRRAGRRAWVLLLASCLAMAMLIAVQISEGVFWQMAPENAGTSWTVDSGRQWWINPSNGIGGTVYYFLAGSLGLYAVTLQNFVGFRVILAFWRLRKSIVLEADCLDADGYYGWAPVRQIVGATYVEIMLHGLGIGAVALMMPNTGFFSPLAFASVQWLVTLPLYVSFPIWFARRQMAAYKEREVLRLEAMVRASPGSQDARVIADEETIRRRIELVRAVPALPFKRSRDVSLFFLSLMADLSAVLVIVWTLVQWAV